MANGNYTSLYRRFRPQNFKDLKGQDHIGFALKRAVINGQVGHAYLFSGPRGTGKTSTARMLAKALNCTDLKDGEPCNECLSCKEITSGTSLSVHELDAASNNGVDAMRDLISKAALGIPGKWKVYIIDEVHMLSTAASNALLKTLEEPPSHVVFVFATTDPQKVLPTIRSRTQHFEFHLLTPEKIRELVNEVLEKEQIQLAPNLVELTIKRARGSARDALSFLELVIASGEKFIGEDLSSLIDAFIDGDLNQALKATANLISTGFDPQNIALDFLDWLRVAFLYTQDSQLVSEVDISYEPSIKKARELGASKIVRAIERIGKALVDMKDSVDSRVILELCFIQVINSDFDSSLSSILERISILEKRVSELSTQLKGDGLGQSSHWTATNLSDKKQSDFKNQPTLRAFQDPTGAEAVSKKEATTGLKDSGLKDSRVKDDKEAAILSRDTLVLFWGDEVVPNLSPGFKYRFGDLYFESVINNEITLLISSSPTEEDVLSFEKEFKGILKNKYGKEFKLIFKRRDFEFENNRPENKMADADKQGSEEQTLKDVERIFEIGEN